MTNKSGGCIQCSGVAIQRGEARYGQDGYGVHILFGDAPFEVRVPIGADRQAAERTADAVQRGVECEVTADRIRYRNDHSVEAFVLVSPRRVVVGGIELLQRV